MSSWDDELQVAIARARRECPGIVTIDDDALTSLLRDQTVPLTTLHAGDLLLAAACLRGDPAAVRLLEQRHSPDLRAAVLSAHPDPSFADEVLQRVRTHLLVGDAPRLASYTGSGALGAWLRVVALRTAISLRRGQWRSVALEDSMLGPAPEDPRAAAILDQHRELLREIVRAAIASQDRRMRTLLRSYYCDGAGVEELGRLYRVHASTISRWLAQTRRAILAETRRRLGADLELGTESVASMLDLVHHLEISIGAVLRDEGVE